MPDPDGVNGRENSWGLAQIDLDYHSEVSKQLAIDPAFAIDFAGRYFSEGKESQFHCYNKEQKADWKLLQ